MGIKRDLFEAAVRTAALFAPRGQLPENPGSILVLRNNDIGDLLAITPLFEALKRKFPETEVVAGIGAWNFDVLRNNPFVDAVLPVNAPWHNGRIRPQGPTAALRYFFSEEARELAKHKFDIGIDVLGSPYGSLLLMRAGVPFRLGVQGYAGGDSAAQRVVHYNPDEHVGRSALRFAELLGATDLPEVRPQIYLEEPVAHSGIIVIAPGGGFPEKCWPVENYVELVRLLGNERIAVIGGKPDAAAGARLAAAGNHVEDYTGRLELIETFKLIAGARLVICNGSMAMHAAAAFRVPALILLGGYFSSAREHAVQWSYDNCVNLGRESGHDSIFTAREVYEKMREL